MAAVLGGHLAVPISLHLPAGARTTADRSYVGVQFPAGGVVLVTVPTQVVDPSGARLPLPADPAAWLARHPDIFVSRAREVKVAGLRATQLDYRRSRMANPPSRFSRLPLFCGWRTETDASPFGADATQAPSQACTRITDDARVRATFVRIGARTVLVEAIWLIDSSVDGTGRIPADLQRSYAALLKGLTPGARNT